jgi:hypothetical protein
VLRVPGPARRNILASRVRGESHPLPLARLFTLLCVSPHVFPVPRRVCFSTRHAPTSVVPVHAGRAVPGRRDQRLSRTRIAGRVPAHVVQLAPTSTRVLPVAAFDRTQSRHRDKHRRAFALVERLRKNESRTHRRRLSRQRTPTDGQHQRRVQQGSTDSRLGINGVTRVCTGGDAQRTDFSVEPGRTPAKDATSGRTKAPIAAISVELAGLEPATSWVRSRRSSS